MLRVFIPDSTAQGDPGHCGQQQGAKWGPALCPCERCHQRRQSRACLWSQCSRATLFSVLSKSGPCRKAVRGREGHNRGSDPLAQAPFCPAQGISKSPYPAPEASDCDAHTLDLPSVVVEPAPTAEEKTLPPSATFSSLPKNILPAQPKPLS